MEITKEQLIARINQQIDIEATIIERLGDDSSALSELAVETATVDMKILDIAMKAITDGDKLAAAEKRIADYHRALNNLAAVARRYLPDYDEHPDIQAADELLESAAGIGKG